MFNYSCSCSYYIAIIIPESLAIISNVSQCQSLPRHFLIIIKDLEQKFVLYYFNRSLSYDFKNISTNSKKYLFNVDFLEDIEVAGIGRKSHSRQKNSWGHSSSPLIETLKASLRRYMITDNVQNTSDINVSVNNLALKLDSENTMLRYLIWVVPSLGFVGTVRGIGQALSATSFSR